MSTNDSFLDRAALGHARALLKRPVARERLWPVLAAAVFAAAASLTFATVVILSPPVVSRVKPLESTSAGYDPRAVASTGKTGP